MHALARAALGKNVSVLIGREPGKCGHIFPGKDVSVLIGREAIFADREASRDASLNAPFFPRAAPSDTPLGAGGVAYIFPWDLRKRRIFNLGLKP